MEDVMRKHLGWLVLWGNVFGAAGWVQCMGVVQRLRLTSIGAQEVSLELYHKRWASGCRRG